MELPGYVTYRGAVVGSSERGGTVVFVKNSIVHLVVNSVDVSVGDQVWLQLKNLQGVLMGSCYIPPCDSPYYSHASFAAIQEKFLLSDMSNGYLVIGDMNCRKVKGDIEVDGKKKKENLNGNDFANKSETIKVMIKNKILKL